MQRPKDLHLLCLFELREEPFTFKQANDIVPTFCLCMEHGNMFWTDVRIKTNHPFCVKGSFHMLNSWVGPIL